MSYDAWDIDGGPAFPIDNKSGIVFRGMTLRDYFAAKALSGMLAYPGDDVRGNWQNNSSPEDVAMYAYTYADAMLAQREKP